MSYITVRGNLGTTHTIVNGMDRHDLEQLAEYMHRGPKHEDTDAVTFFDPVMKVINQLESMFGYEVISCNNSPTSQQRSLHHTDLTMWTMYRNELRSQHYQPYHHREQRRGSFEDGSNYEETGTPDSACPGPFLPPPPPAQHPAPSSGLPKFVRIPSTSNRRQDSIPDRVSFGKKFFQLQHLQQADKKRHVYSANNKLFTNIPEENLTTSTPNAQNHALPWYTRNTGDGQQQSLRSIRRRGATNISAVPAGASYH